MDADLETRDFACLGFIEGVLSGEGNEGSRMGQGKELSEDGVSVGDQPQPTGQPWGMKCTTDLSHLEARGTPLCTPMSVCYCSWGRVGHKTS